ncbi:hypothetical protein D083_3095 [Dickeya solani RNS 08.23.3.1.A]|nr:hypothetical protein D083_3095 [Dickeya solani RNS 08.23.3.1.A]
MKARDEWAAAQALPAHHNFLQLPNPAVRLSAALFPDCARYFFILFTHHQK